LALVVVAFVVVAVDTLLVVVFNITFVFSIVFVFISVTSKLFVVLITFDFPNSFFFRILVVILLVSL
jgi:hypothetical protein